eukprot:CAMPEP_0206286576 /NCGR_PEP_ID=MMETSP0106_2-20121207/670_1 /ASSEMBLY_ACC=CAM_ASM_000206 /TAXON_ID=81532 /ORGANISM="Acanthoeca-like sp., Strain 10tr" /LENGTH=353 /DNA_ID=CAMNT_0053717099 /DNA_START=29 /DNA_END=1087 /DNA_ORIENTATION=-
MVGGLLGGSFTTPARFMTGWEWENFWFVYSVFGLVVCPWAFALLTTDAIDVIYHAKSMDIAYVMLSGFGWGIGSVTFGLGCAYVGDSLAFAIILGLCATFGTAVPMLILSPGDATKKVGIFTWAGIGVVCVGLYLLAKAGASKERDQKGLAASVQDTEREPLVAGSSTAINASDVGSSTVATKSSKSLTVGLAICFVSGVFSGLMNVGLTLGNPLTDACASRGASSINKKSLAWALTISAGFLPNAGFSMYKLWSNGTWGNFGAGSLGQRFVNVGLGVLMGVLWYCGNFVYGAGASGIGKLGTVVGWPIFMVSMVISSTVASVLSGDYKGVSSRTVYLLAGGLFTIVLATVVV